MMIVRRPAFRAGRPSRIAKYNAQREHPESLTASGMVTAIGVVIEQSLCCLPRQCGRSGISTDKRAELGDLTVFRHE